MDDWEGIRGILAAAWLPFSPRIPRTDAAGVAGEPSTFDRPPAAPRAVSEALNRKRFRQDHPAGPYRVVL